MSAVLREATFEKVLREFKGGKLRSSNGDLVTDPLQARAIAHSMAGDTRPKAQAPKKKKAARAMGRGGWIARMLHRHFSKGD